jgi:hypothetical protein
VAFVDAVDRDRSRPQCERSTIRPHLRQGLCESEVGATRRRRRAIRCSRGGNREGSTCARVEESHPNTRSHRRASAVAGPVS